MTRLDLDPEDYAEHQPGKPPLKIRRRGLFRLFKFAAAFLLVTVPFVLSFPLLAKNEWTALGALFMVGVALPIFFVLKALLRPLPPKS